MSYSLHSPISDRPAPAAQRRPAEQSANADPNSRRRLVLGLAGALLLSPFSVFASNDPLAGLQLWGSGEFRRFGVLVYEATLWAESDPLRPPLALRLDYRRTITGRDIAKASVKEMRQLGADDAALKRWGDEMARLFPDVRDGDHIVGMYRADRATFFFNGRPLGEMVDAEFARRFFAIWLDPRTSAPELRAALLKRSR